jgi:hypothetical protein
MDEEQGKEQFLGHGYRIDDVTNVREVGFYVRDYIEQHGKPPTILVHPSVEITTVGVPPEFLESVAVFNRQYVHHPLVILVGNMTTKKE